MMRLMCSKCHGNCYGCFYTEDCNQWRDIAPYNPLELYDSTAYLALCKGRHEIPQAIDGSIFETEVNPLDVAGLEATAKAKLADLDIKHLKLYVTGLSVALIAALNAARELGIDVTLYHFDRETGSYYSQEVK